MPTKSSRKPKKSSKKTSKKATKKTAKKPAGKSLKKSTKKSKRMAEKASVQSQLTATQFSNIQVIPYDGPDPEANVSCRAGSKLNLFPQIIKRVDGDNDPTDGQPRLTFVLDDAHAIFFNVPNCNPDGFFYIPERSFNIARIGGPDYLGTGPIKKIRIKLFFTNPLKPLPFVVAFRLRFEENYNQTNIFNPRRKSGSLKAV